MNVLAKNLCMLGAKWTSCSCLLCLAHIAYVWEMSKSLLSTSSLYRENLIWVVGRQTQCSAALHYTVKIMHSWQISVHCIGCAGCKDCKEVFICFLQVCLISPSLCFPRWRSVMVVRDKVNSVSPWNGKGRSSIFAICFVFCCSVISKVFLTLQPQTTQVKQAGSGIAFCCAW